MAQIIASHETALSRLAAHLAAPATAAQCFAPLFSRAIGPAEFGLALAEALAHLNCLLHQGRVTRHLSAQGAWLWQAVG